jgi:hypothetical protein
MALSCPDLVWFADLEWGRRRLSMRDKLESVLEFVGLKSELAIGDGAIEFVKWLRGKHLQNCVWEREIEKEREGKV